MSSVWKGNYIQSSLSYQAPINGKKHRLIIDRVKIFEAADRHFDRPEMNLAVKGILYSRTCVCCRNNNLLFHPKTKGAVFMKGKKSKFTVRVEEDLLRKLSYVAEYNARSANREVEFLMRKRIAEFEKTHGKIIHE